LSGFQGDGSYSFAAAEKVGPSGRVYATQINSDKLQTLKAEDAKRKLQNVIVVEGAADDTNLPSNCYDTILLRHVFSSHRSLTEMWSAR
jgi:precorrin-6B methylase 2